MAQHSILLKARKQVADGTELFIFGKPAGYVFRAGQYVALIVPKKEGIETDSRGLVRSFSLSSAPFESDIFFTMRRGESSFKRTFAALRPGDSVVITDPVGFFTLPSPENRRPIVFLAGGIGITPVRSILKQAEYEGSDRKFTLLYANRFEKDAAFQEELQNLSLPHFRYVTILSQAETPCATGDEERGYICESIVEKYVEDLRGSLYYIVGSPSFIETMEKMLDTLGVPNDQRKKDPFTGLRPETKK